MEKEIQAIIQGLGYSEKGVYFPEPDCFESIRDLIRFLRYDTHSGLARRLCGEHNLVISDLIPIMKSANTSERLFDVALRLTINLCQPTINVFHGKMPEDREEWRFFTELHEVDCKSVVANLNASNHTSGQKEATSSCPSFKEGKGRQMEKNLCRAKSAFADSDLMSILHTKISSYFTLEWTDRTESMKLIAERIFVLLGYVLSIGCAEYDGQSMFAEANSDDRVVMALLNSGIGEVIVNVAATPSEHDFHLSLLHIIALIVKQREVHNIITADREESVDEKTKEDEELRKCVEVESQKMLETRRRLGSRHTSFAGSYIIKGMKALNPENDLVLQKVVKKADRLEHLYGRKAKRRQPKNRRPFEGVEKIHSSALDVRLALKKFCDSVLLKCYNRLVTGCRDAVTATLGKEGFHHVQTQLEQYLDMAYAERREGRVHGLRAQYALCAYKELLCTLRCMLVSGSNEEKEEAEEACKHIILMEEYRDLSSSIIRRFTPAIFSKTFLRILILASHLYIGLLEKCAKSGNLLKVTKRQKVPKRRTKRRHNRASEESNDDGANQIDVDKVWGSICEELSDIVNGYEMPSEDVSPIDMRLQVDDRLYRQFASLMVQAALRERRVADAVGLYRTARALWPFEEIFGSDKMQPEEEFIAMRVIYFSDLTQVEKECKAARESTQGGEVEDGEGNLFDAELEEDGRDWEEEEEEDEEATRYVTKEVDFSFDQYLMKFARTDVLKWYVFLLNEYETNSPELNKAILKLLHRIAFDLRQAPRLFQISLFRIFTRLAERFQNRPFSAIKADRFFRLYEFGFHLLKRFFASYEIIGSKLIPELLFWKGPKECHDLEYGYGSYESHFKWWDAYLRNLVGTKFLVIMLQRNVGELYLALTDEKKSKEMLWTEELDNEMRSLYDEYVAYDDKPEGIDVVEFIESNLSRERTRRQIIRQLKSLGLDTFGAKVKLTLVFHCVATGGSKSTMFSASVLEQMKVFADQYRSLPPDQQLVDMIDYIRERLPEQCNRSRIIKQLKYEGIEYAPNTNARSHKAWSDMLVTELRSLAEQYEELSEKPSCGLIDYIRTRLTEKRTRRDIEAKLVEIGYDPGKLRTSRSLAAATSLRISTKVPKPWSELLLTELCSLKSQYEELEEDPQCDLADYVIARLSEKRWRRDVINKLAEIGADVSNMQKRRRKRRDKKLALSKANEETSGEERDRSASPLTSGRCRSVASSDELGLDDNLDDLLIASESGAEKNSYDRRSGRSENARSEQGDLISQDSVGIDSGAVEQANLATEAKALFGDSSNEDDEEIIVRRGKRMIEDTLSPPFGESIERSLEPSAPSSKKRIVLSDDEDE
uniref:Timeless N-terminal domain-containing protein n=1 Tax=Ascaris lumbricoides TaxID=6252 RepID=A0A9J2P910_ASCLU